MAWHLRAGWKSNRRHGARHGRGLLALAAGSLLVVAALPPAAGASGIFGTLSNFDVFNETSEPSEGFEIDLEGCRSGDVYNTFPSHYGVKTITEYDDGVSFGTRIVFQDYYFVDSQGVPHFAINPNPSPPNTNGHYAVNLPDCEHFGFAVRVQPRATRSYWLNKLPDGTYERIGSTPLAIPVPTWSYLPPAVPGAAPVVRAEVVVPEPAEVIQQKPDSIWMKIYKTELEDLVELADLMSGPGGIVPQDAGELEIEWELLEGGKMKVKEVEVGENAAAVIRRYEYFRYTGPYDEEHEPTTPFLEDDTLDPVALGHVGAFIGANMVAANLVPEPSTWALAASGLGAGGAIGLRRRRRQPGPRPQK